MLNLLVSFPDRISNKLKRSYLYSDEYYNELCLNSLSLDLSDGYIHQKVLDVLSKVLIRKKPMHIVHALNRVKYSPEISHMIERLEPASTLLLALFKDLSLSQIYKLIPKLSDRELIFFTCQIPFKIQLNGFEDAVKLSSL